MENNDNVIFSTDRYEFIQSKHTKTGDIIFLLKLKEKVSREDYKKIESAVKLIKGYYSSFVKAFVLKTAISVSEVEHLLVGTDLESGKNISTNEPISNDVKINDAAEELIEKMVDDGASREKVTALVKKGIKEEEEHKPTLEKIASGELTPEQGIVEIVHDHEKSNENKGELLDVYFKIWDLSLDEIKSRLESEGIQVGGIWNYIDGTPDKIHFENLTKEQVDKLKKINEDNHAIFHESESKKNKNENLNNHRVFIVHKDNTPVTNFENLSESEASELYEKYILEPNSEIVTWDKTVYNSYGKLIARDSVKMKILKDEEPIITKGENPNGGETVFYNGKPLGWLTDISFEQLSGNKDSIFDADKMIYALKKLGINYGKVETGTGGVSQSLIKIRLPLNQNNSNGKKEFKSIINMNTDLLGSPKEIYMLTPVQFSNYVEEKNKIFGRNYDVLKPLYEKYSIMKGGYSKIKNQVEENPLLAYYIANKSEGSGLGYANTSNLKRNKTRNENANYVKENVDSFKTKDEFYKYIKLIWYANQKSNENHLRIIEDALALRYKGNETPEQSKSNFKRAVLEGRMTTDDVMLILKESKVEPTNEINNISDEEYMKKESEVVVDGEMQYEENLEKEYKKKEEQLNKIKEIEDLIELLEETVKDKPEDTLTSETLELMKETLDDLKKDVEKFEKGGDIDCGCKHSKFEDGGSITIDTYSSGDKIRFHYGHGEDAEIKSGEISDKTSKGYYVVSSGTSQISIPPKDVIGKISETKKTSPNKIFGFFEGGGEVFNDNLDMINGKKFYRYHPYNVNPFEVNYDKKNKYGYGIYFLDNNYYYRYKYKEARRICIKPKLKSPLIFINHNNQIPCGEYSEALLNAMQFDGVKNRDEFNKKMVENGFDSLVIVEPRGIYLVFLYNDSDLYEMVEDIDTFALGGSINDEEKIKKNIIDSINKTRKNYELSYIQAYYLYDNFKEHLRSELMSVWLPNNENKINLIKNKIIDEDWLLNKDIPMNVASRYALTEKGKKFFDELNANLREGMGLGKFEDGGNLMEDGDVNSLTIKNYEQELISLENQIKYSQEQILLTDENWVKKEYQAGIDDNKKRIEEINNTLENIKGLMAKGGTVNKKYAIIHFKDKKPLKKSYDSVVKAFSDYESEGSIYAELFNENDVLLSSFPKQEMNNSNYAKGGVVENLEKELRKLQRDLNSSRLGTYMEGDNSEEAMVLRKEREVKLARFNEVLQLLRENDSKFAKGGSVDEDNAKEKLINILSSLNEEDLFDFIYHFGGVDSSDDVDYLASGYKNWINGLSKDELDIILWRMKMPYFYEFSPKDNYSTGTPVPSKFATYDDFYEKKYKKGGSVDVNPYEARLKRFEIEENPDAPNYKTAIKWAKKNGYVLSNDVSYNGYIFFEKIICNGENKLKLQVYDDIIKKSEPSFEQYNLEADFGQSIMDETKYRFKSHHDHSDFGVNNLDELFALALRKEKKLEEECKNKFKKGGSVENKITKDNWIPILEKAHTKEAESKGRHIFNYRWVTGDYSFGSKTKYYYFESNIDPKTGNITHYWESWKSIDKKEAASKK